MSSTTVLPAGTVASGAIASQVALVPRAPPVLSTRRATAQAVPGPARAVAVASHSLAVVEPRTEAAEVPATTRPIREARLQGVARTVPRTVATAVP